MNRIIFADDTTFTFVYFMLKYSPIDFSKPISLDIKPLNSQERNQASLWNGRVRVNSFKCQVGTFEACMSSEDFEIFTQIFSFGMGLVSSPNHDKKEKNKAMEKQKKMKMTELNNLGFKELKNHLKNMINEMKDNWMQKKDKSFEFSYSVDRINLEMIKYEERFLKCKIDKLEGHHSLGGANGYGTMKFKVEKIKMINPTETDKEKRVILRRVNEEESGNHFLLNQSHFNVLGKNKDVSWRVVDNLELVFAPTIVRVTQELYESFSEWVFSRENKTIEKNINENIAIRKVSLFFLFKIIIKISKTKNL